MKEGQTSRVLVYDDELSNCKLVREYLVEAGFKVGYSLNLGQFQERLQEGWDLILLDLNLEDTSGLDVLRELNQGADKNIPVIIITGEDSEDQLQACFQAGAVDYITKPFSKMTLVTRTARSVGMYAEMDGHRRKVDELMNEFKRFVPPDHLEAIFQGDFQVGDMLERDYTIFFGDIRGYTTLAEELGAKEMSRLLDRVYSIMEEAITSCGGLVNEFIGDAVLALFSGEDGAQKSLAAATSLHKALDEFNLLEKPVGISPVTMGIGIHSGLVFIGALGSQKKVTSTIIGDTVNVAARIEELTKRFTAKTLISDRVKDQLINPPIHIRHIEHLILRGRSEALDLYEVYDCDVPHIRECKDKGKMDLSKALSYYHQGEFSQALEYLQACIEINPSDGLLYDFIKRCQYYIKFPPKSTVHLDLTDELFLDWNVRRRFARRKVVAKVSLRSSFKDMGRLEMEAEVVNMSVMGMCLKFKGYLRMGDTVMLNLDFPEIEDAKGIKVLGKVRWLEDAEDEKSLVGFETQPLGLLNQKRCFEILEQNEFKEKSITKVLILDDDLSVCKHLRSSLSTQGVTCSYIVNSEDLFFKLEEKTFDLLLVDLFMPNVDGFQIMSQIRNHNKWYDLPIIAMTSDTGDQELIKRCFELGANDFIEKPPLIQTLMARIHASLNTSEDIRKKSEEVQEVNIKLRELLIRSEEDAQNKGMILANMSHELRTPLNGLISTIELIPELPKDSDDFLTVYDLIKRSSQRLHDTVDSLMTYANLERQDQKKQQKPFSLGELISHASKGVLQRHGKKNLAFDHHLAKGVPVYVMGDEARMIKVLSVLLDNAFKFTHEGEVKLEAKLMEDHASWKKLRFEVTDTGIGFNEEQGARLLESFMQSDQALSRNYEGSGLGLAIAKRCCDILDCELHYKSQVGKGSRFWFDIDLSIPSIPEVSREKLTIPPQRPKPIEVEKEKMIILLVEDNEDNVSLIKVLLKKEPFEIKVAKDGLESLAEYSQRSFDLILMDVHMPNMDGLTATKKIRELEERDRTHTPIVALTALARPEDRDLCFDSGMDSYLSKPVRKEDLINEIYRWVHR